MRMLDASASQAPDVEVLRADQDAINAFSRYSVKLDDAVASLKAANEEREEIDELAVELELADDDDGDVMYKVDTTFVYMPPSRALERCEKRKETLSTTIEGLEKVVDECEESMKKLKSHLYAKFGKSINLEKGDE